MDEPQFTELNKEEGSNEGVWENELRWVFRLMPTGVLSRLEEVIEFAITQCEYRRCGVSCGEMRYLIRLIGKEQKVRLLEGNGIGYKEAMEVVGRESNNGEEQSRGTTSI